MHKCTQQAFPNLRLLRNGLKKKEFFINSVVGLVLWVPNDPVFHWGKKTNYHFKPCFFPFWDWNSNLKGAYLETHTQLIFCQAQFQLASSVPVQFGTEISLNISVTPPHPPNPPHPPTRTSIFEPLIDYLGS